VNEFPPIEELAERYRAGASLDDLAVLCEDTPYRIRSTLVAAGVAIRPRGSLPTNAFDDPQGRGALVIRRSIEDMVGRYRAGASLDDLAVLCRCSAAKVRTLLLKAGVELRPRGKRITMSNAS
jgi:predicted nucleic acid-binding Zn ribbon protein